MILNLMVFMVVAKVVDVVEAVESSMFNVKFASSMDTQLRIVGIGSTNLFNLQQHKVSKVILHLMLNCLVLHMDMVLLH